MLGIPVEFGDKEKELRFDFNAMSELEESFGKGIVAVLNEEQVGFRLIREFYHKGLKHGRDRGLTLDRTGKMLMDKMHDEGISFDGLMKPIFEALDKSGLFGDDMNLSEEMEEMEEDKDEEKN